MAKWADFMVLEKELNSIKEERNKSWDDLLKTKPNPMEIVEDYHSKKKTPTPLDKQVGGSHYRSMKIQPVEFILANDLGFCEGNVVKYICRYRQKGGVEDLKKVIHYAELLINQIEGKDK